MTKTKLITRHWLKICGLLLSVFSGMTALAQPTASFTVSSALACVGDTITMTSTSTAGNAAIVNYIWSAQGAIVEQAQGATMTSFSFVYTNAGTYNLGLIVQDFNGIASNSFQTNAIQVFDNPQASIVTTNQTCSIPFQLNFNSSGSTTGSTIQYIWSFPGGNPTSFTGSQTTISYPNEGAFQASLQVINTVSGCSDQEIKSLNLTNFIADFTVPASFCKGTSVQVFDSSSTGANQWTWSCTGGAVFNSNTANPFFQFNQTGTQTITLIAKNTIAGCTDVETKTVQVFDVPQVSFTEDVVSGCAPKVVNFSNTSPTGNGAIFTWDFGDGSPTFTGAAPPPHTYLLDNRMYFPKLSVTNANGCSNSFIADTIYLFHLEANFSASPPLGCAPIDVQFTDQSYSQESVVSWNWDFGDGTTSSLQNPTHQYACGVYNVSLVIQNQNGCMDTVIMSERTVNFLGANAVTTVPDATFISVSGNQIYRNHTDFTNNNFTYNTIRYGSVYNSDFIYAPPVLCVNEMLTVTAITPPPCPTDNDIRYIWNFEGFGNYPTSDSIFTHIFFDTLKTSSAMDISLSTDFRGCISNVTTKTDVVYLKAPLSLFQTSSLFCNQGPGPHQVFINDSLSIYGHEHDGFLSGIQVLEDQADDDVEVFYDWGDGTDTTIVVDAILEDADKGSMFHTFTGYGSYNLMQIITNHTLGCADTSMAVVNISNMSASILTDSACVDDPYYIAFNADTPSSHFPLSYTISTGTQNFNHNGVISFSTILPNPPQFVIDHVSGIHAVTAYVTNAAGCKDTVTDSIRVLALPQANIFLADDTVCNLSEIYFSPLGSQFGDDQSGWSEFIWNLNNNGIQNNFSTFTMDSVSVQIENQIQLSLQVVDGFGCESANNETVTIYTQSPNATFVSNPFLCNDVNELIDGSSSDGTAPLSYQWYLDGTAIPNSNDDSLFHVIQVVPASLLQNDYNYSLVVSDNKGCSDSTFRLVTVSNPRITNVETTFTSTYIDANGNFTCPPVVVDFEMTYQTNWTAGDYNWSLGNDFDTDFDSYNQNPTGIQYVQAGSYDYYVEMTESVTGCVFSYAESPFLTIGGPSADILIFADTSKLCGMSYFFKLTNPSANLGHWIWNLGDGTTETSQNNPDNFFQHTYLDVNDFEPVITIYDDSTQCAIPITINIDAFENGLNALFEIIPDEPVVDLDMLFDDHSTSSNSTITSWIWDFGDGDSLISGNNESVNHIYLNDTAQFVTLTITDEYGCTDQYILPISIYTVNFLIPNIITNVGGNGSNSLFTLFDDIFKDFEIVILNRWGNIVYKGIRDESNPVYLWDGRDYRSGETCSDGVYYYKIEGLLVNGKTIKFQDFLTLSGGK